MLLLGRDRVAALLPLPDCIEAVAAAFGAQATGMLPAPPGVLATHLAGGGFHVKVAALGGKRALYAAKVNANFPDNPGRRGLPAIQGVIALFDATDGRILAVMDSIEITILRTAAASAVAARHLARTDARTLLVCGCGTQGRAHVRALALVRPLERVFAFDSDPARARAFAREMSTETGLAVEPVPGLDEPFARADIAVTCTPSRRPLVTADLLRPGQFIAAVGADSEGKQELDPEVLARARVVADLASQAAHMGDLQHAIAAGLMRPEDLHAELGEVVAGLKPGRRSHEEIFVFDSTGIALEDVAAAAVVYERAVAGR